MNVFDRFAKQVKERDDIFVRLKNAGLERAMRRPENGGWNSFEILYHLQLSERGIFQLLQKQSLKPTESFGRVGVKNRFNCWLLYANLISPLKFKAPSLVSAVQNHPDLPELEASWNEFKSGMNQLIPELAGEKINSLIFRHHRAGWMDLKGVLGFLYFHQAGHLKQIRERAGL